MSKYTWDDMDLCKECHFKDKNPDLCHSEEPPREKPSPMNFLDGGCGRFLRESKWQRLSEKDRQHYERLRKERNAEKD